MLCVENIIELHITVWCHVVLELVIIIILIIIAHNHKVRPLRFCRRFLLSKYFVDYPMHKISCWRGWKMLSGIYGLSNLMLSLNIKIWVILSYWKNMKRSIYVITKRKRSVMSVPGGILSGESWVGRDRAGRRTTFKYLCRSLLPKRLFGLGTFNDDDG